MDASPIRATVMRSSWPGVFMSAMAMPRAAEIALPAWPQVKVSYMLSEGDGKPLMPPKVRWVANASRRPVSSLWAYA